MKNTNTTPIYRVYGKLKTDKRFKPFDMNNNQFEINLIKVSYFYDNQIIELRNEVSEMNRLNQDYIFEIRKG